MPKCKRCGAERLLIIRATGLCTACEIRRSEMSEEIVGDMGRGEIVFLAPMEVRALRRLVRREIDATWKGKPEPPKPLPETAEEETARRSLEFVKRFGLKVVCGRTRYKKPHLFYAGGVDDVCLNPSPAEPLTVDVVLEVVPRSRGIFMVGRTPTSPGFIAWRRVEGELVDRPRTVSYGTIPLLALLRALDAAGVMKKTDRTAKDAKED